MENFNVPRGDSGRDDLEAEVDDLTEKLKSAMERRVMTESSLARCEKCQQEVVEESVLAGAKTYHQSCFLCVACGLRLTGSYYEVNGNLYCQEDRDLGLPSCGACGQPLTGQAVTVSDQSYHVGCFVCTVCMEPIKGKFFQEAGKFLCLADYQESREKCSRCAVPLLERSLVFKNKKLHPECFRCVECNEGLDGEECVVEEDKVLCHTCYKTKIVLRCCNAIVSAGQEENMRMITCNSQDYHVECYTCQICSAALEEKNVFLADDNGLVCELCHNNPAW